MTKIVAALCIWVFGWAVMPGISFFYFSFLLWLPVGFIHLSPVYLRNLRRSQFRRETLELLNNLILKMRGGSSFRSALQSASQDVSEFSRVKVEKILECLTLGSKDSEKFQHDPDVENLLRHFRLAESDAHRILPRLCQLRENLKVKAAFQKKVSQVLQQHQVQLWVLTVLYIVLFVFILFKFGWTRHAHLILISFILYTVGFWVSFQQGRRFRWKV